MTLRFCVLLSGTLLVGALRIAPVTAQEALPPPPPADATAPPPPADAPAPPEGVDVLARGPVHEAYAEPTETRPQPSPLIEKQPPNPIDEVPPDQKPDGDNVQWIPGYWSWDADQSDYVWVSGFWRIPPPGRQWVPGTWQQVEGGWHWVPGFWATAGQQELQYLPTPPPTLDQGPSVPAPQANSTYVPGCWIHRETRYLWRPGFWVGYQPGWIWIPAHYVWTPAGCLFVEGYWDHPLAQRGLLFAPVRLAARLLSRPRWFYTPQYVVQPDFLMSALFVQPANCHYYFGDYFANRYQRAGFVPWIDYRIGRSVFDPNFAYYRHTYAGYGNWERGLRDLYAARIRGDIARPPITLVQQNQLIRNLTGNKALALNVNRNINFTNGQNVSVLTPLAQLHNAHMTNLIALANVRGGEVRKPPLAEHVVRLQALSAAQRQNEQRAAAQVHAIAQARQQSAARLLSEGPPVRVTDKPRQAKLDLSRIPGQPVRPVVPRPGENPRPVATPPARKVLPPTPPVPRHEERPIPKHEVPRPVAPPKHVAPPRPAPQPVPPRPAPPPKQVTPPRPAPRVVPPPAPPPKHVAPPRPAPQPLPPHPAPPPKKEHPKKP